MKIYEVKDITEADFGCEESGRKEPVALLKLVERASGIFPTTEEKQKTDENLFKAEVKAEKQENKFEADANEKTSENITESEEKYIEMTEADIEKRGISEGKKVIIKDDGTVLKYVRVVAAVIRDNDKIFATARGYGEFKGWWEFPGGKIEKGETPEQALVREIKEELTATIKVEDLIHTIEYDYPTFHLSMDCFFAKLEEGDLVLKEAESAKWLTRDELDSVNWLPADKELIEIIKTGF